METKELAPTETLNPRRFLVQLSPGVYIGDLGEGNQGVQTEHNANHYTRNGAARLAGQFSGAVVVEASRP